MVFINSFHFIESFLHETTAGFETTVGYETTSQTMMGFETTVVDSDAPAGREGGPHAAAHRHRAPRLGGGAQDAPRGKRNVPVFN